MLSTHPSDVLPGGTLSVDLDDVWTYLKVRGDPGWRDRPTHFPLVVPALLDTLTAARATATVFVVGADAALPERAAWLRGIAAAGHEIGNHSHEHCSWQRAMPPEELAEDLRASHDAITRACGAPPRGYRAPGFSWNRTLLEGLVRLGYRYDASVFPTWFGPLARSAYRARSGAAAQQQLDGLFGDTADGRLPLSPFQWSVASGAMLLELPVTTVPYVRTPLHHTYIAYLASFSESLAMVYLAGAMRLCRQSGTSINYLLHPTDLIGADAVPSLRFFPGMEMPTTRKQRVLKRVLAVLSREGVLQSLGATADRLEGVRLATRTPVGPRDR